MTEYKDRVERQRLLLEAEEWAQGVASLHAHSLSSMWYDTRPQDTEDGKGVVDKQFHSGLIERTLHDGTKVFFGKELKGNELIDAYLRHTQPSVSQSLIG